MERVRLVCSHPMALAQAASWLRRELPEARLDEVDSTAEAARRAALEPGWPRSEACWRPAPTV